jgi:hypothetical protein
VDVRESAPNTTPPSNSTAMMVVPESTPIAASPLKSLCAI